MSSEKLLSFLITASGLIMVVLGYRIMSSKLAQRLPLFFHQTLKGEEAVKVGKSILVLGVIGSAVGILFVLFPS